MRPSHVIEALDPEDLTEAGEVLGRAFCDNPGVVALLDRHNHDERLPRISGGFRAFANIALNSGAAHCIRVDGRIQAVQLSFEPGSYPPSVSNMARLGPALNAMGLRSALRFLTIDRELGRHHPRTPHHYLWVLGVDPEAQGRGLGSAFVRTMNAHADARNVDCYLETDKISSVQLYSRHGYRVIWEQTFPALCHLRLWWMLRPAHPPSDCNSAPGS